MQIIIRKIISVISFLITAILIAVICYLFGYKQSHPAITPKPVAEVINQVPEKKYVKILFVGDMMFDRGIRYSAQQNGGNDFIFDKVSSIFQDNNLVVGNLEGSISDNKSVSLGSTAGTLKYLTFTFDPSWAETLFKNNIRLVDLGNNHILNFGQAGYVSTKSYLDKANVGYFGGPDNPRSTSTTIDGVKMAFVSYNEFSLLPNADEIKLTIEEIKKVKETSDIVIVYNHWGTEFNLNNTNSQRNLAHQFIDAGADLIIGGHPHVIEPIEIYNGKRIYYSLGNFVFDQYFNENVRNSIGVEVKVDEETKQMDFAEKKFYLDNNGQTIEKTEVK